MTKTLNVSLARKVMRIKLNGYYQALVKNSRNDFLLVYTHDYSMKNVMSYRKVCNSCVELWMGSALKNECLEIYDVMLLPLALRSIITRQPMTISKKSKAT